VPTPATVLGQAGELMAGGFEIRNWPRGLGWEAEHCTLGVVESLQCYHEQANGSAVSPRLDIGGGLPKPRFPAMCRTRAVLTTRECTSELVLSSTLQRETVAIAGSGWGDSASSKTSPPNVSALKDNRTVRPTYSFLVKDIG
jgi:hypothetical protein